MTYDPALSYKILNKKSGRALSLRAAGSANGSRAILWDFVDAEDQHWHIVDLGNGYYKLVNNHSGRALSTLDGGSTNGTIVHIWDYLSTFPDQQWAIGPGSAGFVKITNRNSGRAVSCFAGGTGNDTDVHLWDYLSGFDDQDWSIVPATQFVDIDANAVVSHISPHMTGACLEDVNHEVYGGIYSQIIYGESFQEPPPLYDPNTLYKIVNRKSGRALSVLEGGSANGTPTILWDSVDATDQFWRIVEIGDGFYKLINHRSDRALATLNGGSSNETVVHIWDYLGNFPDQHWAISPGAGFVVIRNRISRRALSCRGGGTSNGTRIHLWDYVGIGDQDWLISSANLPTTYDPATSYKILNKKSGRALSVHTGGTDNGSRAILWDFINAPDQRWHIVALGDGYYELINDKSTRALSTLNGGSVNGTIVHIWDYLTTYPDQHWTISPGSPGFVRIANRGGGRALSCLNGGTENDTTLHLWDYLGGFDDQDWSIVPEIVQPKVPVTQPGVSGMWRGFAKGSAEGSYLIDTAAPFKGSQSQRITYMGGSGEIGIENQSLNRWGMNIQQGKPYRGYLYVRTASPTTIHVGFESPDGAVVYAEASLAVTRPDWARYDFTLSPNGSHAHGRFAIKLKAPGSVFVGHAFVEPGPWGLFDGLPVRGDIGHGIVAQKNSLMRFGGSAVNAETYRWKAMLCPRDLRAATWGTWYPYSSNGWGIIDFLNFAEAASVVGIPALNIDETQQDVLDFIDYVNGPTSTPYGLQRANDGHAAPYNLRYLELGNEEAIDLVYWNKFRPLAEAVWKRDPDIILVVGDFRYDRVICDPFDFDGHPSIRSLAFHKQILDFARDKGREVWFDCHIWADAVHERQLDADAQVHEQVEALCSLHKHLASLSPRARFKLVVFEVNANSHDMNRALAYALALGMLQRAGDKIQMAVAANALQPDEQNDNGWNQGLLFFNPVSVWAQPAYYVTQMVAENYLPLGVQAKVRGRESITFDVTATRSMDGKTLTLHVVNTIDVPRTCAFDISGFDPQPTTLAHVTTLAGPRHDRNSAENPNAIVPVRTDVSYRREGNALVFTFPPSSFTVVRMR